MTLRREVERQDHCYDLHLESKSPLQYLVLTIDGQRTAGIRRNRNAELCVVWTKVLHLLRVCRGYAL